MPIHKVSIIWEMHGIAHIEADSLALAKEKVFEPNFVYPPGHRLEDSTQIDEGYDPSYEHCVTDNIE
jgi:hypothetical protein